MVPELTDIRFTAAGAALEKLPRYAGVYRFFGPEDSLLYIGKSVDIHARVLSHINEGRKPGRHHRLMSEVRHIDCTATSGETGALLIENAAIKAERPLYNRRQRQARKLWTLQLTPGSDGFLKPKVADFCPWSERAFDSYGLYHNKRHVDSSLRRHARDHGLCLRMLGLDAGKGPCFQYQLKRCDGACAGEESAEEHNARLLSALDRDRIAAWPFPGALALREHNLDPLPGQPAEQFHLVQQWCYVGSFTTLATLQDTLAQSGSTTFDRDAYRLLFNAMRRGRVEVLDAQTGKPIDNPLLGLGR